MVDKTDPKYVVWKEGDWFVAQCIDIVIASQGHTEEEAVKNLHEAIDFYFTPPVATVIPRLIV